MTNFLFTGAKKEATIENMETPIDITCGADMACPPVSGEKAGQVPCCDSGAGE